MFLPDTMSLTDFRENAADHVKRIKKSHRDTLLTQKGRATLAVMSTDRYEELLEAEHLAELLKSIDEGDAGDTVDAMKALQRMRGRYTRLAARSKRKSARGGKR